MVFDLVGGRLDDWLSALEPGPLGSDTGDKSVDFNSGVASRGLRGQPLQQLFSLQPNGRSGTGPPQTRALVDKTPSSSN